MISLTYLSLASTEMSSSDLEDLLTVSRDRNALAGVTGLLLYADRQFIQTLEGERSAVEATMDRIVADPRHHDVDVTLVDDIEERYYPDWTMGFRRVQHSELQRLRGYSDFLEPSGQDYRDVDRRGRAGVFHRQFRDVLGW